MVAPQTKTKIFLDSGDPQETREAISILGKLDGQTTNPSLVAKKLLASNHSLKLTPEELMEEYKKIVFQISEMIPHGSVSIEVYAHLHSSGYNLFNQATKMFLWIPNAHIKFPITQGGIEALNLSLENDMRANMTLCFSQEQAAAVAKAAMENEVEEGDVFVSPFIGRLDDMGVNGMDLIENIAKMYRENNSKVNVLAASVRNFGHFMACLKAETDIITAPLEVLKQWADSNFLLPSESYDYSKPNLKELPYESFDFSKDLNEFNISHPKTDEGLNKFARDWEQLFK